MHISPESTCMVINQKRSGGSARSEPVIWLHPGSSSSSQPGTGAGRPCSRKLKNPLAAQNCPLVQTIICRMDTQGPTVQHKILYSKYCDTNWGSETMTNLDSILKSRDVTSLTKVRLVKAMVFPAVMYGCESWTVKKAECRRIDAFELWCWRRLLRVPWTARRSNQSILKEISTGC